MDQVQPDGWGRSVELLLRLQGHLQSKHKGAVVVRQDATCALPQPQASELISQQREERGRHSYPRPVSKPPGFTPGAHARNFANFYPPPVMCVG